MASPGGTSSGSSLLQSREDNMQQNIIDLRKRKRTISNRESARRSRMRKQYHLDQLRAQVIHLRAENIQIATSVNLEAHLYLNIESQNSILRTQASELNNRLQSLNEIICCINTSECCVPGSDFGEYDPITGVMDDGLFNPWNLVQVDHHQPIMASSDVLCAD